ncbi:MAG: anti-sigma regulatory factor [Chloroflexi bacterium]|nr:anti-sigma regulatory factor [Chloroflexota bacterium]
MKDEVRVTIKSDVDVVAARQEGRALAAHLGFSTGDLALIATAISEVARNIVNYAKQGEIILKVAEKDGRYGIVVVARDQGPGIADVARAMQDGHSTSGGLGLGLPGSKRVMDDFDIVSEVDKGTTVTMKKWAR